MTQYNKNKEKARQNAINWQYESSQKNYSYFELFKQYNYFKKIARRYGLIKEFKENGLL